MSTLGFRHVLAADPPTAMDDLFVSTTIWGIVQQPSQEANARKAVMFVASAMKPKNRRIRGGPDFRSWSVCVEPVLTMHWLYKCLVAQVT